MRWPHGSTPQRARQLLQAWPPLTPGLHLLDLRIAARATAAVPGRRAGTGARTGGPCRRLLPRRLQSRAQPADVVGRSCCNRWPGWPHPGRRPPPGVRRAACAMAWPAPASRSASRPVPAPSATSRWPAMPRGSRRRPRPVARRRPARRGMRSWSAPASRAPPQRARCRGKACAARCSTRSPSPHRAPRATRPACSTARSAVATPGTRAGTAQPPSLRRSGCSPSWAQAAPPGCCARKPRATCRRCTRCWRHKACRPST